MRRTSNFKPGVDRLESREVLSAMTFAPHFIIRGHGPRPLPPQGIFAPLAATNVTPAPGIQAPVGSTLMGPGGNPVAISWNFHR